MTTLCIYDPVFLEHDTGPGHPECADRLHAIMGALAEPAFQDLSRRAPPEASAEQLQRVHAEMHVRNLLALTPGDGLMYLDGDTCVSPGSREAALKAAGAGILAVDAVQGGEALRAFCPVRPPGHHATNDTAMGFCLFNNIAVAAAHAQAGHGLERVAIVDFDVHHGNGTQQIAWRRPGWLYLSSHQSPLYPGTGSTRECGAYDNVVNAPLPPRSGSAQMRHVYEQRLLPRLAEFQPQLVLISAGFDAHRLDPLASLEWTDDDFGWVTRAIVDVANDCCQGRVIAMLEGGYHLRALATAVAAHVRVLMDES